METTIAQLPYRHTQVGYATLIGLAAGVVSQLGSFVNDMRARRRRAWLYPPGILLFACLMYAFSSLSVEVRDEEVEVGFTGGLARRRFAIGDIEAVEVTSTPWYYGWGIRRTPNGWLYNVWGRDAVTLTLAGERRFSIGSDEPEALLAAIEAARGRAAA
jgi:hypothetical protein